MSKIGVFWRADFLGFFEDVTVRIIVIARATDDRLGSPFVLVLEINRAHVGVHVRRHVALQIVQAALKHSRGSAVFVSLQHRRTTLGHANVVETQKSGRDKDTEDKQNQQLPRFDVLQLPNTAPYLSFVRHLSFPTVLKLFSV